MLVAIFALGLFPALIVMSYIAVAVGFVVNRLVR
jgi:hypothetical protein